MSAAPAASELSTSLMLATGPPLFSMAIPRFRLIG